MSGIDNMNNVFLCGHTGSYNRGCEAILRSTAHILKSNNVDNINAFSFAINDDIELGVNNEMQLFAYPKYHFFISVASRIGRLVFHNNDTGYNYYNYKVFKYAKHGSVVFNVGGDTYCYDKPMMSYTLNKIAKKRGIPNVFWGCTVDDKALKDHEMQEDLNRYSFIVSRESITTEILSQVLKDKKKLYQACDPAFQLPIVKTDLPVNFIENNTVGINLSPLIFSNADDDNDIMYKNVEYLINYILDNTDMGICLIPHVYKSSNCTQDLFILKKVYSKYIENKRVSIVNKELSCTQLKYIISKCRFFIGARTHSTIAAYSTAVPTIVLSYSQKSIGIAKDLFGTSDGFAVSWKTFKDENQLTNLFVEVLLKNEESIKKSYDEILPDYKQSILDVTNKILRNLV